MKDSWNFVGIIPARSGSKGLPGKNSRLLCGKPLIEYSIEQALSCGLLSRVIVSTDAENLADIAQAAGAEVPFLRPAELAGDDTGAAEVITHSIRALGLDAYTTAAVYLQPTSPLRTVDHIRQAIQIFQQEDCDTVVSVVEVPHNFGMESQMELTDNRLAAIGTSGLLSRQSKPRRYARNGPAVLICRASNLLEGIGFYDKSLKICPLVMDARDSCDIDNLADFELAEYFMTKRLEDHAS